MKRRLTAALALAALSATGALAALAFAPAALAWSPDNLPPGWSVTHGTAVGGDPGAYCREWYWIMTTGHADTSPKLCTDSPTYQQDFDAWVDARYSPPPSSTALPPPTTTVVLTTTTPATTTTTAATTTAPTDTTAQAAPAPAPAPVTQTVTVTTTVTPVEQSLQAQIDALAAQLAALTDRVTRLEKAGDASWLAFQQSVASGDPADVAAGIARGTWLNAVNQLGAFAP